MESNEDFPERPPSYFESIADSDKIHHLFQPFTFVAAGGASAPPTPAAGSGHTLVASSPGVLSKPLQGQKLTFYDFLPHDVTVQSQETFSYLLRRANAWLRSSPTWRVQHCETIRVRVASETNTYLSQVYYEDERKPAISVLGIRLWVTNGNGEVQPELGVEHMVAISASIVNRVGKTVLAFENVEQLLERYKRKWENQPIPGRVLSVDTRKTFVHNLQSFNPETVVFRKEKHYTPNTLEVIRVFYEVGTPEIEDIEIVDFIPVTTIPLLRSVKRQSFEEVFETARTWLKKHCLNKGHRILNIQTLELDVRPGGKTNTSRLWSFAEAKKEFYVRFIRASYASGSYPKDADKVSVPAVKTFLPVPIPGSTPVVLKLEPLEKCRERLEAWIKATGAGVLSVETVWLRSSTTEDMKKTKGSSGAVCSGSQYRWLSAVRVYLDKEYPDPPAAMLPSMPKVDNGLCCIM